MNPVAHRLFPLTCLLLLPSTGCSSKADTEAPSREAYLGLEQPANGFQVRSIGRTIEPGTDVEFCEVAELPGSSSDVYYVNALELGNGPMSHHLIVDAAAPGTAAAEKLATLKVGDSVPCLSAESAYGDGFESVAGIQQPYGKSAFPEGVGRKYYGGQRIVFDYHYYNTGSSPVEARSAVNFHLTDEANVKHIARVFAFSNWTIDTPPGESRSFLGECKFDADVTVSSLVRHTHRWGTDYSVWFLGGERDGAHVWTSKDFQEDVNFEFDAPFVMKAGEGFRFQCDFENTETEALRFGLNATDEMCILFGQFWEAEEGQQVGSQGCSMTVLGDDGIARPASDSPFRPPTAEETAACRDTGALSPTCADCACSSCGGVIADCSSDEHCNAILECVRSSGCSGQDCAGACRPVFDEHSSGLGMLIQLSECMSSTCDSVCSFGGGSADGGAP